MNLAGKDIRHNLPRFLMTMVGIGLLLMVVMGMGGIYRGLVMEATLIIDRMDADIWVVQENTNGPFAEVSKIPQNYEQRLAAIDGVSHTAAFVSHTLQRQYEGRILRLTLQGLQFPEDTGNWLPLIQGRTLSRGRYEMLADKSAKLPLGTRLPLGKNVYTVIGITSQMNAPSGDAMVFVSLNDALEIMNDRPAEAIREERQARVRRLNILDLSSLHPDHEETAKGEGKHIPALGTRLVSAILVKTAPGYDVSELKNKINNLPGITAYDSDEERQIMLRGFVARSKKQLWLFRIVLVIVSTVIMALIIYTLTLDKLHTIALLKLIGARNKVIVSMIFQQSLLLGIGGFFIARFVGEWFYPLFPRRVVLTPFDLSVLFAVVIVISLLGSILGIRKAMRVDPGEILS